MAQKKNPALGKGLGAIFGSDVEKYLDDIQTNSAEAPGRREIEIPVKESDRILISHVRNLIRRLCKNCPNPFVYMESLHRFWYVRESVVMI